MTSRISLRKIIRKYIFFLVGLLVLSWVVFVNRFPEGYVMAGGDAYQLLGLRDKFFSLLFYSWEGKALPFYSIFCILDYLGASASIQLSFYLGIFIFGSYLSFYFFTLLIFKKMKEVSRVLPSLFYALNLYTLYVFSYIWGYTHYQCFYIFIPILTGLFIKFLLTRKNIYGAYFVIFLFLSSSGFANPAFALAFAIFLILLIFSLVVFKVVNFNKIIFKKIILLVGFSFLVNLYWIFPLIPEMRAGVANLFSGNIIDLDWWLIHTANPVMDTWRLMQYHNWFFPRNFPYPDLYKYRLVFSVLVFIPVFLVFSGFILRKKKSSQKRYWVVGALFLVFTALVAKVIFPFEQINSIFYHLWGFNTLRGYEKLAIFTPFIFSFLFANLIFSFQGKRIYLFGLFLLVMIIATPLPFFIGKLQQNTSAIFVRDTVDFSAKDYRRAKYSFLLKIPDEYYAIRDAINNDPQNIKIAVLPFSVVDSFGWSNYPKWKLAGADVTQQLYQKDFIPANSSYFKEWFFAKKFNDSNSEDPCWIVELLGILNTKYIIYHKDVEPKFIRQSLDKMKKLEQEGLIIPVTDNVYFTLYKLKDDLVFPLISWQTKDIELKSDPASIDTNYQALKDDSSPASFVKINPKKYEITGEDNGKHFLVFSEPFNPNWKAYATYRDKSKRVLNVHYIARGYANGWEIKDSENIEKITLEYFPLRLLYWGIVISGVTVLSLLGYLVTYYYGKRKRSL